ncbi:hypothetical protein MPSEU_001008800 [Mayamaea pseudoterrestris]|nr:hypothetical protein MPSEU_001008800 [Mayamaea pseudoterrestris]
MDDLIAATRTIEAEDTTRTLALTLSQEFAAAIHPPPQHEKKVDLNDIGMEHSRKIMNTTMQENDENQMQRHISFCRQGTPFRVHPRSNQGMQKQLQQAEQQQQPNGGLRITAPARLFTIQQNQYMNDETSLTPPKYGYSYSDRALAAQERRMLRRQMHAREEATFYDAQQAAKEFQQYREIATQSNTAARIRAYRSLCGYEESAGRASVASAPLSNAPPRKGCLIRNSTATLPSSPSVIRPALENAVNVSISSDNLQAPTTVDGYSTPTSSPDQPSNASNSKIKRSIDDLALAAATFSKRRVRFAPLSAAEFDADAPAHTLTPLPPKQAAQLELQINSRKHLAEEAQKVVQQQRQLAFDPDLHQTTLENAAILSPWEGFDHDDDNWQHAKRQKRRSSGQFAPSPGGQSLLDDDNSDEEEDVYDSDDEMNQVTCGLTEHTAYCSSENQFDFVSHNDSLSLDAHQAHMSMGFATHLPLGQTPSVAWRSLLTDPGNMEVFDMPDMDVWNDLALLASHLQPPHDQDSWVSSFAEHSPILRVWELSLQAVLASSTQKDHAMSPSDKFRLDTEFAMEEPCFQESCVKSAELNWEMCEMQALELLVTNLRAEKEELNRTLVRLDKLETLTEQCMSMLPCELRCQLLDVRTKRVEALEQALANEDERGHMLASHLHAMHAFLTTYQFSLGAKATMMLAPCEVGEDETGDIIYFSSPIQNLYIRLYRTFDEQNYRIQAIDNNRDDDTRQYDIDCKHKVADFYRWNLEAIIAVAQDRDYCDGDNVLELATTINRLRLATLDLMCVYHYYAVAILHPEHSWLVIVDIELPNRRRLHVFYDMNTTRCLTWCLPSLVQVIQSDGLAMLEPPPMALYAMNVTGVIACRFILAQLCHAFSAEA